MSRHSSRPFPTPKRHEFRVKQESRRLRRTFLRHRGQQQLRRAPRGMVDIYDRKRWRDRTRSSRRANGLMRHAVRTEGHLHHAAGTNPAARATGRALMGGGIRAAVGRGVGRKAGDRTYCRVISDQQEDQERKEAAHGRRVISILLRERLEVIAESQVNHQRRHAFLRTIGAFALHENAFWNSGMFETGPFTRYLFGE